VKPGRRVGLRVVGVDLDGPPPAVEEVALLLLDERLQDLRRVRRLRGPADEERALGVVGYPRQVAGEPQAVAERERREPILVGPRRIRILDRQREQAPALARPAVLRRGAPAAAVELAGALVGRRVADLVITLAVDLDRRVEVRRDHRKVVVAHHRHPRRLGPEADHLASVARLRGVARVRRVAAVRPGRDLAARQRRREGGGLRKLRLRLGLGRKRVGGRHKGEDGGEGEGSAKGHARILRARPHAHMGASPSCRGRPPDPDGPPR
jgi:hypothetical protein